MIMGVTVGNVPMAVAVAVPLTCEACQVETDEVIGTEAGMTFGHLDTPQNPHE